MAGGGTARSDSSDAMVFLMNVTTEQVGTIPVVRVSGQLDSSTADDFAQQMAAFEQAPGTRLVLDLEQVGYVSSAGLRVLLALFKKLKAGGGGLVLASVHPRVQDILEIAGFTSILPVSPTTPAAIQSFSLL
ncbi:MAG: STAS domain-containing protein [Vicinamibacterales bacterium]